MKLHNVIRALRASDIPAVKHIIDANGMFPPEYVDGMVEGYLQQTSDEFWLISVHNETMVNAVAYCAPERMTEGTWNLLLIAVTPSEQGQGVGQCLINQVELTLVRKNARVLLVETSDLEDYALTRQFYPKCGYREVARIPEYYERGDGKVVFWKSLST